ncbi:DUF6226 family protein, partial [Microbacterium sp. NRRL B-14842]|uniref:DUF6226 family protein n=1 Tax=Microbacterium sp. NRRL B-14842 TaxID=3162881 RepID=UPI003D26D07E
ESYSRESHPERFGTAASRGRRARRAPLREYEVEARRESGEDGTERVVLEPARGARVVITPTVPSVSVEAGAHFHAIVPSCICDACDETAETAADELERILLSVAAGGFREKYPVGRRAWLYTEIRSPDGERRESSSGPAPEMPARRESARPPCCAGSTTAGGPPGRSARPGLNPPVPSRPGHCSFSFSPRATDARPCCARTSRGPGESCIRHRIVRMELV